MPTNYKLREGLETLKPYHVDETEWELKLDANERTTNLPPLVREQVADRLANLAFNRYPDMGMLPLRSKIARDFGLTVDNVLIGNGSSEILAALCFVFGGRGRRIIYPHPSFSMYGIYTKMADSTPVPINLEGNFTLPIEKVLAAAADAALIILCNPNNPTGTIMAMEAIESIVAGAACPVVVDEAYIEFYGDSAVGLLDKYNNLIITRTFSKAYGLASARVGYMLASADMVATVSKVMMPYHVNALSLAAAEVVYDHKAEFEGDIAVTVLERERVAEALENMDGFTVFPSYTNFILLQHAQADKLTEILAQQSIGIRSFGKTPGLENCLRITIGTPLENDQLLQAIAAFNK